jgi:hypothetical protein
MPRGRLFANEGKEIGVFAGCGARGRQGASRRRASVARATPLPPAARNGRSKGTRSRAAHRHSRPEQRFTPQAITSRPSPGRRRGVSPPVGSERPPNPSRARASLLRDINPSSPTTSYKHRIRQVCVPCRRHVHSHTTAAILRFVITS